MGIGFIKEEVMKESNNIYVIQRDRDKKFYGWEGNWVKTLMEAREYNHVPGNFHPTAEPAPARSGWAESSLPTGSSAASPRRRGRLSAH